MKKRKKTVIWIAAGFLIVVTSFWIGTQLFKTDVVVTNAEQVQADEQSWTEERFENSTSVDPSSQTTVPTSIHLWENADSGALYRPPKEVFCDQYTAYVYCTDESVQDYVKMRNGPSKEHFEPRMEIPNFEKVTVETKNVDGWTLCYYKGMEGWIKTTFLFSETEIEQYR